MFRGVVFPWLLHRDLGFSMRAYWRMHVPAITVLLVLLVLVGGAVWLPITTWPRLVGAGLGVVVVFLALVLALVPDGRAWLVARLRRVAA